MATAIARGAIVAGIATADEIAFYDTNAEQQEILQAKFSGCILAAKPEEIFERCHRIVLSVKPQILIEIAASLRPWITSEHLLVSIAAGVPIAKLASELGTERIVRVMPNTPCQALAGASGIAKGRAVTVQDLDWCESLFSAVGIVVHVTDNLLHAVTGVSGSGPAYVLMMIEALSDGGVMAGLSRQVALELATQTVMGTAKMVQETGVHPAILREQVTSPAGTTIAALAVMERSGFRSAVIDGVTAAVERSRELAS